MGKRSTKVSAWITDDSAYWQVETMQAGFYGDKKLRSLTDGELEQFSHLVQSMAEELKAETTRRELWIWT